MKFAEELRGITKGRKMNEQTLKSLLSKDGRREAHDILKDLKAMLVEVAENGGRGGTFTKGFSGDVKDEVITIGKYVNSVLEGEGLKTGDTTIDLENETVSFAVSW